MGFENLRRGRRGSRAALPQKPKSAPQSMTAQMIADENQRADLAKRQEEADVSQHEKDNAARAAADQKFEEDRESVIWDYQSAKNLPPRKPSEWTARGKPFTKRHITSQAKADKSRAILDELLNRKQGRYDLSSKELTELKEEHGTNWRSAAERKLAGGE